MYTYIISLFAYITLSVDMDVASLRGKDESNPKTLVSELHLEMLVGEVSGCCSHPRPQEMAAELLGLSHTKVAH